MYHIEDCQCRHVVTIISTLNEASDREGGVKMVLAFGRSASLTSFLLVHSVISTLVRTQAPDDAKGQTCSKPAVPDGVVRLLDAGWYLTLLTGGASNAGWTQTPPGSVGEFMIACKHVLKCGA